METFIRSTLPNILEVVHALRRGLLISWDRQTPVGSTSTDGLIGRQSSRLSKWHFDLATRELLHTIQFLYDELSTLDHDPAAPEPKRWVKFCWRSAEDEAAEICLQKSSDTC
jgi:hypothetical protein